MVTKAMAAVLATKDIGLAVLATTLSLMAVFLPVAFMSGMVGQFFRQFGLTVSAAVLIAASHFVIACARRFVDAFLATLRMPVPRSDGPLRTRRALAPVGAGVLVARRRPSRAPPVRGCS